ncbi:probable ATP-dependent RNA helicase DDX43 [Argiope bruennichi]|uniref:RNA helicase n=1 Tax=Argiope bruennichi TaxID=94029 RepID=A0A8T0ERN2_ARGBR|nr:probable ATP-dependent RNA helicase DDX43 [Argiope bruennichi]KAF8774859.1 putative ATP-dependent RNA helicase DDX43 like protein [Argiope bruennichi]
MEEYWDDGEEFLPVQPVISRNEQPHARSNDAPRGRSYNSNSYNKEYSANGAGGNFREDRPRNSENDFSNRGRRTFSRGGRNERNWRPNEESSRGGRNERNWRSKEETSRGGRNERNWRSNEESSEIQIDSNFVGRVIGRGGSKIQELQTESGAHIKILQDSDVEGSTSVRLTGSPEAREKAKTMIEELTTDFGRMSTNRNFHNPNNSENTSSFTNEVKADGINTFIDWDELNKKYHEEKEKQLAALPKLIKNFYKEDPVVAAMTKQEVNQFRAENNNITVMNVDTDDNKPIPNPVTTFEQAFQHYPELLEELKKQDFSKPSPIQSQAWPIIMSGYDLIGIAQTGTGKTIAFLFPALIHIVGQITPREERVGPSCVILAPTRELAQQIEVEARKYSYCNITSVCIYGGGSRRDQINVVTKGVDIVIATPGRLNDLVMNKIINVSGVTYLVLDEADRMLDLGFEPQIRKIVLDIRPDRQTIMTSATWTNEIQKLAARYMKKPIKVNVGALDLAAVHSVTQQVIFAEDEDRRAILEEFLASMKDDEKVIVFVERKSVADDISSDLILRGVELQSIHGDREQIDREQALNDIKTGYVKILIATDVASRGLDVKDITHVFNMYFPHNIEEYVHRVGRTGRAGRTGTAISIFTRQDWMHAESFIKILEEADQFVPKELYDMADRYRAWKRKKEAEDAEGGFRRRGRGGGRRRF